MSDPVVTNKRSIEASPEVSALHGRKLAADYGDLLKVAGDPTALDCALQHLSPDQRPGAASKLIVDVSTRLALAPHPEMEAIALIARQALLSPDRTIRSGTLESLLAGVPSYGAFVACVMMMSPDEKVRGDALTAASEINPRLGSKLASVFGISDSHDSVRSVAARITADKLPIGMHDAGFPDRVWGLEYTAAISAYSAVLYGTNPDSRAGALQFVAKYPGCRDSLLTALTLHPEPAVAADALKRLSSGEQELAKVIATSFRGRAEAALSEAGQLVLGG